MNKLMLLIGFVVLTFGACKSTKDAVEENATQSTEVSTREATPRGEGQRGPRGQRDIGQMFARMDANSDGKISKDEMRGPMAERFEIIDLDKNGFVSKEELEKAPRPERGGRRKQF